MSNTLSIKEMMLIAKRIDDAEKTVAHQQDIIRWLSKAVVYLAKMIVGLKPFRVGKYVPAIADFLEESKFILKDEGDGLEVKCGITYVIDESGLLEAAE